MCLIYVICIHASCLLLILVLDHLLSINNIFDILFKLEEFAFGQGNDPYSAVPYVNLCGI